jgi:ankyrin repeat protein
VYKNIIKVVAPKTWFEDKERQRMAEAIINGNPDELKKLLAPPLPLFENKDYTYPLLTMAVGQATTDYTNINKEDRIACVSLLLQAGASITSSDTMQELIHFKAVSTPNTRVLKTLLEHGADPNVRGTDYSSGKGNVVPIIFEAITEKECIRLLLEHGGDPNATKPSDSDRLCLLSCCMQLLCNAAIFADC